MSLLALTPYLVDRLLMVAILAAMPVMCWLSLPRERRRR